MKTKQKNEMKQKNEFFKLAAFNGGLQSYTKYETNAKRKENKRIKQLKMCLPREEQSNDVQKQNLRNQRNEEKKKKLLCMQ